MFGGIDCGRSINRLNNVENAGQNELAEPEPSWTELLSPTLWVLELMGEMRNSWLRPSSLSSAWHTKLESLSTFFCLACTCLFPGLCPLPGKLTFEWGRVDFSTFSNNPGSVIRSSTTWASRTTFSLESALVSQSSKYRCM